MNTDTEWERWGSTDPYFGVLTDEKYRSRNLTADAKTEFFDSGREHVQHVLEASRRHLDPGFAPQRVLDFGCGVGRLVIPFAEIARQVVGLDVSESMLKEARKNCDDQAIENVTLLRSDDTLSLLNGSFDLIHSFIVLQHIPVDRGELLLRRLLDHLNAGGVLAMHVTYAALGLQNRPSGSVKSYIGRGIGKTRRVIGKSLSRATTRLMRPSSVAMAQGDPSMQMNSYDLNRVFSMIHSLNPQAMYIEPTNHGGVLGLFLYMQKPR